MEATFDNDMLPEGWSWVELKDLVDKEKQDIVDGPFGSNLKSSEFVESGVPVLKIQNIKADKFIDKNICFVSEEKAKTLQRHSFRANDLIITKLGDPLGLCCKVPEKYKNGIIVADLIRFRPSAEKVFDGYLIYVINSVFVQGQFKRLTKGTTRPRVNLTMVREIKLPFPPLPEQRMIVDKIESLFAELDNAVDNIDTALRKLKIYRQAVLQQAFTGELTKQWREEHPDLPTATELLETIKTEREEHYQNQLQDWKQAVKAWEENGKKGKKPTRPKKPTEVDPLTEEELERLSNLPNGWMWSKLGNSTFLVTDGTHYRPIYLAEGVPFLSVKNVRPGKIFDSDIKYISKEQHLSFINRCKPEANDILYTKVGATYGYAAVNTLEYEFSIYVSLCLIKFPQDKILPKYLEHCLNSRLLYAQAQKRIKGIGRPDLHLEEIRDFHFPICSLAEQKQIVAEVERRLSVCDRVEEELLAARKKSGALRQSILKRAFEGKLLNARELEEARRAPDWEPADQLLRRLEENRGKKLDKTDKLEKTDKTKTAPAAKKKARTQT